jgi:hypothetical protein
MADFFIFVVGIVIGFLFGLIVYWLPLRQFKNEFLSLWHLATKRYKRFDRITVGAGVDIKPLNFNLPIKMVTSDIEMIVA